MAPEDVLEQIIRRRSVDLLAPSFKASGLQLKPVSIKPVKKFKSNFNVLQSIDVQIPSSSGQQRNDQRYGKDIKQMINVN